MIGTSLAAGTVGLPGLFVARAFVPMFAAALTMRFAPEVGWIAEFGLLQLLGGQAVPSWFTDDLTLVILGVLALAEILAHKSSDAREFINLVDQWGKPLAALLTYLGILSLADQAALEALLGGSGSIYLLGSVLVAGGTFLVGSAHNAVLGSVIEVDEDDDTGAVGLLSWAQDLWSLVGVVVLILFPVVMVVLVFLVMGMIFVLRRWAQALEEGAKVACGACGQEMYRAAVACSRCQASNPEPAELSWLGTATQRTIVNRDEHRFRLQTHRRCRRCAIRLPRRMAAQACPACQSRPFDGLAEAEAYDAGVLERLPRILLICAGLSLIPVLGLIPGIIVYRLNLVAPYRRYIPRGRGFLVKLAMWFLFFFLIVLQVVPGLGVMMVPIMALISFAVYRRAFWKELTREHGVG